MAYITFREIQRRVGRRISNLDTSTVNANDILPKIKDWINERYQRILDYYPWPQIHDNYALTILASTQNYALARDVDKLVSVYDETNGVPINIYDVERYIRERAVVFDQLNNVQYGNPTTLYEIGEKTVKNLTGSTAETISIVSSSSSDQSPIVVYIKGKVSDVEVSENVVVTGAVTATSSNTYDANQYLQISVGTNDGSEVSLTGIVSVTGTTSGNVLTQISKFNLTQIYKWIAVSPQPLSSGTQPQWRIWYRRRFQKLINDNDIPIIDCEVPLVEGVYSDALREDGQETPANNADNKFSLLVDELWSKNTNDNVIEQFIPSGRDVAARQDFQRYLIIN